MSAQSPVYIAISYKNREQNLGAGNLHSICPLSGLQISWNWLRSLGNAALCSLSSTSLPCTQWIISIKSIWLVFLGSTPNWIFSQCSNHVLNTLSLYLIGPVYALVIIATWGSSNSFSQKFWYCFFSNIVSDFIQLMHAQVTLLCATA